MAPARQGRAGRAGLAPRNGEGSGALRRTPHFWSVKTRFLHANRKSTSLENALEHQPACKPGSVGHRPFARTIRDGHSSGATFARCLEQPTRTASLTSLPRRYRFKRTARVAVPIRSCSRCGLPCRFRCRTRGALLPHLFTLAAPAFWVGEAVRSLWHCPWGCPRRKLSGTVCRWSPDFPLP